jgi:hypothetical protein
MLECIEELCRVLNPTINTPNTLSSYFWTILNKFKFTKYCIICKIEQVLIWLVLVVYIFRNFFLVLPKFKLDLIFHSHHLTLPFLKPTIIYGSFSMIMNSYVFPTRISIMCVYPYTTSGCGHSLMSHLRRWQCLFHIAFRLSIRD